MIGQFLKEVISATGNAKQTVLRKYHLNQEVRLVLLYTYDPYMVYHLKPTPVSPENIYSRDYGLTEDEMTFLTLLSQRKLSGLAAEARLYELCKEHGNLLKLILCKNLQAGIGAATINKVMPGLIPQFKVQLAETVPLDKVTYPCIAQLKYDGVRLVAICSNSGVELKTRNGNIVSLPGLEQQLSNVSGVLDGELIFKAGKSAHRTSVSGLVNSAMHGGRVPENYLEYKVFDYLTLEQFKFHGITPPYSIRYAYARDICDKLDGPISCAENYTVDSAEAVESLVQSMYAQDYEGLILKQLTDKYKFKRSKDWVKVKQVKSAELEVIRAEEGEGKYSGMIGALKCRGIVEGKVVTVSVGTGLSDKDRGVAFTYYDGLIIEIKYNSLIQDSRTGDWSLFLPVFVAVRFDKT